MKISPATLRIIEAFETPESDRTAAIRAIVHEGLGAEEIIAALCEASKATIRVGRLRLPDHRLRGRAQDIALQILHHKRP
jgi:hypothetical protein